MKILINADDFGWSSSCTDAIMQAFDKGFITSTTLCANGAAFDEAVRKVQATEYKNNVGIHFVLTEGYPLTEGIRTNPLFCDENGCFHGRVARFRPLNRKTRKQILDELTAQAQRIADTGLPIHHADSHHHVHTAPFITPIVLRVMARFGIVELRIHRNIGPITIVKKIWKRLFNRCIRQWAFTAYLGSFADVQHDKSLLYREGVLEIMCHPDLTLEGDLVDRCGGASYEAPDGDLLEVQFNMVHERM